MQDTFFPADGHLFTMLRPPPSLPPLRAACWIPPSSASAALAIAVPRPAPRLPPPGCFPARWIRWAHAFLAVVSVSTREIERAADWGFSCRCVQQSNPVAPGRPATCRAVVSRCKSASNISDRTLQPPHGTAGERVGGKCTTASNETEALCCLSSNSFI